MTSPFKVPPGAHIVPNDPTVTVHKANGHGAPYWMDERFRGQWEGEPDEEPQEGWLVNHIIPQTGVGMLAGQSGMGKTFTLLDLVQATILGRDFAGHAVDRPGAALLLAAEAPTQVRHRWEALRKAKIRPWFEQQNEQLRAMPFKWITAVPQLIGDKAYDDLMGHVLRMQQELHDKRYDCELVMIAIDTLAAAADFKDQNDAAEGQRVMNMLARVAHTSGAVVLIVDHFGKDQDRGVRGTSAKEGAADFVLAVLGDKAVSGTLSNTRLAVRKLRGGATGVEVPFSLNEVKMGDDETGEPVTSMTVTWLEDDEMLKKKNGGGGRPPKNVPLLMQAVDEALIDHGQLTMLPGMSSQLMTVEDHHVRDQFYKRFPPTGHDGRKRQHHLLVSFGRACRDAVTRQLIASEERGGRVLVWRVQVAPPPMSIEPGDENELSTN